MSHNDYNDDRRNQYQSNDQESTVADTNHGLRESFHLPPCVHDEESLMESSSSLASQIIPSPLTDNHRRTPPVCMAQQTISIREAAKSLSRLRLRWDVENAPIHYLIVHKMVEDADILPNLWMLIEWILHDGSRINGLSAEEALLGDRTTEVHVHESLKSVIPKELLGRRTHFWMDETLERDLIDLIISVGGDGTVLHAAWLFQKVVPPIVPFHSGTVGFLNVFAIHNYAPTLHQLLEQGCRVNVRTRLNCRIRHQANDKVVEELQIMNEMVVDRGSASTMIIMDLFIDGQHLITTIQADGLIIATPTGSTAYSLSAGGSVAHPEVPIMLVTPICPHTLSMRPLILPDSLELTVRLNPATRSSAWIAFDGRRRVEFGLGDSITVTCSDYPVPTVCREDQTRDWFTGLAQCLHWNDRPGPRYQLCPPP